MQHNPDAYAKDQTVIVWSDGKAYIGDLTLLRPVNLKKRSLSPSQRLKHLQTAGCTAICLVALESEA